MSFNSFIRKAWSHDLNFVEESQNWKDLFELNIKFKGCSVQLGFAQKLYNINLCQKKNKEFF